MLKCIFDKFLYGYSKDVVWNLAGFVIPVIVGIIFIPLIINSMGVELFGVLSIIWILIGYFTLFDLGISRALTFLLSKNIGVKAKENNEIYSTAIPIILFMGVVGGCIFWFFSEWLSLYVFNINASLTHDIDVSFKWTAIAIPFTIWATALRACLESYFKFKFINAVKIPVSAWLLIGPYIFYEASGSFSFAVSSLFLARVLMFFVYFLYCNRLLSFSFKYFNLKIIKDLFLFGGWMTVSNVISPIMVYFDRFLIGAYLSVGLVGYYSAPYEMVTKMLVISVAFSSVFFPAISHQIANGKKNDAINTIRKFSYSLLFIMGGITVIFIAGGKWILQWWLGNEFRDNGYWVMVWISIGVFFNSLAQIPFSIIQATGDSKKTALIHLMEVPIYIILLFSALLLEKSISLVALIWCVRVFVDFVIMSKVASRILNKI